MIQQYNFRDPVEYIVDQYFNRKKLDLSQANVNSPIESDAGDTIPMDNLPQAPVSLFRNANNQVDKVVYGNVDELLSGNSDVVLWMQELTRDGSNKLIRVTTTYPDGESVDEPIERNPEGKVIKFGFF